MHFVECKLSDLKPKAHAIWAKERKKQEHKRGAMRRDFSQEKGTSSAEVKKGEKQ